MQRESGRQLLTPERWRRMEFIFQAANGMAEPERSVFVRDSSQGDRDLAEEVQALLWATEEQEKYVFPPAIEQAEHQPGSYGVYQVDRELGHGGMGSVYLAHRADGEFEQRVALKLVSPHLRSEFFTERFRMERQILAGLDHPNVTRLLDGGVGSDGSPYLVMEYVDGQAINRYCDERSLSVPERVRLFLQVCAAVEYAHRNLIVHRDLKPGNIFVTTTGVPKLLDFGTAKLLATAANDSTSTRFGVMTPRYASPEQLRGEPVTTLTDVYSLGVVLYELLTGAWPFGDPDSLVAGLERAVREVEPARPGSVVSEEAAKTRSASRAKLARMLDGDLRNIVVKAMQADPRRRYGSVEQLSADLERHLDGEPVVARGRSITYRTAKFVGRNWLAVSLAGIFILGLSVATGIAIRQARVARAEVAKAETVTRFLEDVIYAGDPDDVKDRTVLQAMEIARGRLSDLKDQPEAELRIRAALGYVYMQTSLYPQAKKELLRAEVLARETGNTEMLASTLRSIANVDDVRSRAAYMEALEIAKNKGNQLSPNLRMGIFSEVGQLLGFEGHSPEVEQTLRQAVQIARSNSVRKSDFAIALSRLGQYVRYENRLDEAEALQNEALGLLSSHPSVSSDLAFEELAAIRIKRGDLVGGERFSRQRRDLLMRLDGPENGTTQDSRSRWASLQARLGHIPEALQEMRENIVYSRKAFPAGSFGLWHPLATLAYILNMAGQPAEALSAAKESLACFGRESKISPSDLRSAMIEAEAGVSLAKLHRYSEAVPYLEDSYRAYSASPGFGPNYYSTLRIQEYLDNARAALGGGAGVRGPKH